MRGELLKVEGRVDARVNLEVVALGLELVEVTVDLVDGFLDIGSFGGALDVRVLEACGCWRGADGEGEGVARGFGLDGGGDFLEGLELGSEEIHGLPFLTCRVRVPSVRVDPMEDELARLMPRQQLLNKLLASIRSRDDTRTSVPHIHLHEDKGHIPRLCADGCNVGELLRVVDHEGQAAGAELLGYGGEAVDGGRVEGEPVEDVEGAGSGGILAGEGEEVLGLEDGGDDEVDGFIRGVTDLELCELKSLWE